jgi:hypothetical protein
MSPFGSSATTSAGDAPATGRTREAGRRIQLDRSRATFVVPQYDVAGKELIKGKIEAGVAG